MLTLARIQLVVRLERRRPVGLVAVGRENRAVLPVGERDLGAGRELDRRVLQIGGGQRGVGVAGRRGKPARQGQQALALVVEHVLLLAVEILDREAVDRQIGVVRHPGLHLRQRNV